MLRRLDEDECSTYIVVTKFLSPFMLQLLISRIGRREYRYLENQSLPLYVLIPLESGSFNRVHRFIPRISPAIETHKKFPHAALTLDVPLPTKLLPPIIRPLQTLPPFAATCPCFW